MILAAWMRNGDFGQLQRNLDDSYQRAGRLSRENERLRVAVELAITHIDGTHTKFSERESVAVLQQLRLALVSQESGSFGALSRESQSQW